MSIKSEANGFTLIELIFSILIFSIGMMAVAGMHGMAINANATAKKYTDATTLASDMLEKFRAMEYDDTRLDEADSSAPHEHEEDTDGGKYKLTWTVDLIDIDDPEDGIDDMKRIRLNVTWKNRGQTKRFEPDFEFVKSRGVRF